MSVGERPGRPLAATVAGVSDVFGQGSFALRMEWGRVGAAACLADVTVVVDVLSFSTAVTVAVERGTRVFPSPWDGERARALALEHQAVLAVGRAEARREGAVGAPSLSPAGLLEGEPIERLVLPSPNGSAIAAAVAVEGSAVALGCLRNARATAEWLGGRLGAGQTVAVIAAGERWSTDGSMRPALEDHLGAGAILARLRTLGWAGSSSPEAAAAAALFEACESDLARTLRECASGRELRAAGFGADVEVAAALDMSSVVPVLDGGAFVALT